MHPRPRPRVASPIISLVISHGGHTRVVRLVEGQSLVIGRDPSAEISVNEGSLSRRHASFDVAGSVVTVTDLGSTNGTQLNGDVITGKTVMSAGDEVSVGTVTVSIHVVAPASAQRLGLWSHDQFLSALEDEVDRARTFRRGLGVVMIRHAGDEVSLVTAVRAATRSVDRVAAYGDGTLELLLPEATNDQVIEFARQVTPALRQPQLGFALYPSDGTSSEALIESSREAMHRASETQAVQGATPAVRVSTHGVGLISVSPAMRSIFDTVSRVAASVIPVLIRGETGTGKEVLARAIHERSMRAKNRLVSINCGAIPASLVESVLFGHEKGAFTGATHSTRGVFEEADGSTVLLDEIGELSAAAQAALLRVLEAKEVRRVGGAREVTVNVRVIAATHRDLDAMVKAGTFREDLLYRLNAMTLEVPPLRERPDEIGPFAERFVTLANAANVRHVQGLDADAMRLLLRYPWPGNIRELRNAIEHAVVIARGELVQAVDLPKKIRDFTASVLQHDEVAVPGGLSARGELDLREGVQRYEKHVILEALRGAAGNRTEAARRLQIPVRTLSHKIRQYGIKKLGFGLETSTDED